MMEKSEYLKPTSKEFYLHSVTGLLNQSGDDKFKASISGYGQDDDEDGGFSQP